LAKVLGAIGRTLITAGTLILLFVAYQLWGTGIYTHKQQHKGRDQFEQQLAEVNRTSTSTTTVTTDPVVTIPGDTVATLPPVTAPDVPAPEAGQPAGQIQIPAIGVDWIFYEGVDLSDLKKGPGHYPQTPLPGQAGNAGIAGHRTTFGAPFANVDKLAVGDDIFITTLQGKFTYKVTNSQIVAPSAIEVLQPHDGQNELTLTACHPKYSARQRIVISAALQGTPIPTPPPDPAVTVETGHAVLSLSGTRAPRLPAILWGLLAALVWMFAWLLGRIWRKWPSYALMLPVFLLVLFFFFDNFARLLPSNY
jgi:sortase A